MVPAGSHAADSPFAPCGGNGLLCATLTVPLDYGGQAPGAVSLHVEELPAAGTPRGVMLLLAGGPGQASARVFDLGVDASFWQAFFPGYTLVAYDDRGTGDSGALDCASVRTISACADSIGPNRIFYSTHEHAEDIESIRVALGVDKLALFGGSYGTEHAYAYALAHPDHVERLLLDSVVALPRDPYGLASLQAIPNALRSICAAGGCPTAGRDVGADFAALANRLVARPPESGFDGRFLVSLAYLSDIMAGVAAELPAATEAGRSGNLGPLERLIVLAAGATGSNRASVNPALELATDCADGPFPWAPDDSKDARLTELESSLAALPAGSTGLFGPWATEVSASLAFACTDWPAPSGSSGPAPGPLPDVPVLMLSGDRDVRTPTSGAAALASQFPQGHVLVVPGLGHFVITRSPCAQDAVRGWLDGTVPPSTCPRVPLPVPVVGAFRASVNATPPLGRGPIRVERTVAAAIATLRETLVPWLLSGGLPEALPGLAGGSLVPGLTSFSLVSFSDVPGLELSGKVNLRVGSRPSTPVEISSATLSVSGTQAVPGTLRVSGHTLRGLLAGRRVSAKL